MTEIGRVFSNFICFIAWKGKFLSYDSDFNSQKIELGTIMN